MVEAAVFGIDDATHGQTVKAVVVVRQGTVLDPDALRAFCAETLSSYKVPVDLEIGTTPLPRNATGKVMNMCSPELRPVHSSTRRADRRTGGPGC